MMRAPLRLGVLLLTLCASLPAKGQGRTGDLSEAKQALEEARAHLKRGEHVEAEGLFRKAIRLDPQLSDGYEGLSQSLFVRRKHAEAVELLRGVSSRFPDSEGIQAQLAMHLYSLKRYAEALPLFKKSIGALRARYEIQALAGQCCLRLQDHRCAIEALGNFLDGRPAAMGGQDHVARTNRARAHLSLGELGKAEADISQALRTKPDYAPALGVGGELALRRNDCARAVRLLEQLGRALGARFAASPQQVKLGQAYLCARQAASALTVAETLLARQPNDLDALLLRADASFALGRLAKALADYERLAARTGNARHVRVRIAELHFRQGQHQKALSLIEADLGQPSVEPRLLVLALRASLRLGRKADALRLADRLAAAKDALPEALYFAGIAQSSSGRFDRAIELYRRVLRRDPKHAGARLEQIRALCYLARAKLRAKANAEALVDLRRAHALDPRSLAVNRNLALVQLAAGNLDEVEKHLKLLLDRVPRDAVANRLAGRVALARGKPEVAQAHLEIAVQAMVRLGGTPFARALAESALVQLRLGRLDRAVLEAGRALELARRDKAARDLLPGAQQILVAALLARATGSLDRGRGKPAWTDLERVTAELGSLPPKQQRIASLTVVLSAFQLGKTEAAQKLLKAAGGELAAALRSPYDKVGRPLLELLGEQQSASVQSADRLLRLGAKLPAGAREVLGRLARGTYERSAEKLYYAGQYRAAKRSLASMQKLGGELAAAQQHNLAVVDYHAGDGGALARLRSLQARVPLALCNLGVHHEKARQWTEAYDYFRQCERQKVSFPELRGILEDKQRVLGK